MTNSEYPAALDPYGQMPQLPSDTDDDVIYVQTNEGLLSITDDDVINNQPTEALLSISFNNNDKQPIEQPGTTVKLVEPPTHNAKNHRKRTAKIQKSAESKKRKFKCANCQNCSFEFKKDLEFHQLFTHLEGL